MSASSFTHSPSVKPAYTCGTHVSFIDIDDDDASLVSIMNPYAKEFVPSYYTIEDSSEEARRIDDILRTVTHGLSVYDSELESLAQQFADADYPLDEAEARFLDQEEALASGLHVPGQKAKGNTYGRKRKSGPRSSR